MKKAVVLLAEGFEEVEAITPIDYLRRAGIEVTTAAVGASLDVRGSHGIVVRADALLTEAMAAGGVNAVDAVALPGGMPGAANLAASAEVTALIRGAAEAGAWICAICASPAVVLAPLGFLDGLRFTCYPGMEDRVTGGIWSGERVVVDGRVITSRGAGTAGEFAAAIIGQLVGEAAAEKVARGVLLR